MPLLFRHYVPALCVLATLILFPPTTALGQDDASVTTGTPDVRLRLGGLIQSRVSYGWTSNDASASERIGFGIRRARLRAVAHVGPRAGLHLFLDGAPGSVQVLDAYFFYQASDRLRLRLGRMVSAQPRAFILTSAAQLDAIDRAASAELWGRQTISGDGRDFGLDVRYQTQRGQALLFVHNGDGDWNRLRGNYRESITGGGVTGGVDRGFENLAISFYSAYTPAPGLEIGGFVGYNGSENPNTAVDERGRAYATYAGHVYWGAQPGSQPVRLKADVIGIQYEDLAGAPRDVRNQQMLGYAVLGAVRIHRSAEVFGRFEQVDPNLDVDGARDTYVTGGASFSPSALRGQPFHHERLTLGYAALLPNDDDAVVEHLLVLQAQIAF